MLEIRLNFLSFGVGDTNIQTIASRIGKKFSWEYEIFEKMLMPFAPGKMPGLKMWS